MSLNANPSFRRMSDREQKQLRIERLVSLLRQSNELLIGMGQYIADNDPNRKVVEEVVKSNTVVLNEEQEALRQEELRTNRIITLS